MAAKKRKKKSSRIADNPSFKELRRNSLGLQTLTKLSPLWKLLGVQLPDDLAEKAAALARETEHLTSMPDRFNDLFADRGWIAYEMLKQEVMEKAVELGEAGDVDAAEELLVEHFNEETIDWGIKFMMAHEAFHPRERLARLALDDYLAERYHASIPLVLMIIDGFVNDVSKSKGFFAKSIKLEAWDSIAAHDRGLQTLSRLWQQNRKKTTTETLSEPYRHGILHGRDLGYDNRTVAAKTWACLFALREWAVAVHDDRIEEPPPERKAGFFEVLREYRQVQEDRAKIEAWKPRGQEELAEVPRNGPPEAYGAGTPERAVAEFMHLWERQNFGHMARLVPGPLYEKPSSKELGKTAGELRTIYESKKLLEFEISEIQDEAAATTDVKVDVRFEQEEQTVQETLDLRLLYLDDEGSPSLRDSPNGSWCIQNLWLAIY